MNRDQRYSLVVFGVCRVHPFKAHPRCGRCRAAKREKKLLVQEITDWRDWRRLFQRRRRPADQQTDKGKP